MSTSEVVECLAATLNPDTNTRIAAELKLSEWFTRQGAWQLFPSVVQVVLMDFASHSQMWQYLSRS